MKKVLVALAVVLAVAIPIAASASTHPSVAAIRPHVVGTWPNDVSDSNAGGYVLWSNGRVQTLDGAPYYGSVTKKVNDIVGFEADGLGGGYWIIGANGAVYARGSTCQDETLVAPKNAPKSKVVGAINLKSEGNEGFEMITASGHSFAFSCQFTNSGVAPLPAVHSPLLLALGAVEDTLAIVTPARYPKYLSNDELAQALGPRVRVLRRAIAQLRRGRLTTKYRSFVAAAVGVGADARAGDRPAVVLHTVGAAAKAEQKLREGGQSAPDHPGF